MCLFILLMIEDMLVNVLNTFYLLFVDDWRGIDGECTFLCVGAALKLRIVGMFVYYLLIISGMCLFILLMIGDLLVNVLNKCCFIIC